MITMPTLQLQIGGVVTDLKAKGLEETSPKINPRVTEVVGQPTIMNAKQVLKVDGPCPQIVHHKALATVLHQKVQNQPGQPVQI